MRRFYFLIAAVVLLLDQVSKYLVVRHLAPDGRIVVIANLFDIIYTRNRGIAFGILSDSTSRWQNIALIVFSAVVITILGVAIFSERSRHMNRQGLALALILGGATGNLADRLTGDGVVDFLDFYFRSYHWHTFNLADSAIVCGALLWATALWIPRPER